MLPFPRIKSCVGRRGRSRGQAEHRVKRRHWIKAAIKSEHIFIEISLEVLWTDGAMMRAKNPSFEV